MALAGTDVAMSVSVSSASPESRDVADLSSHDAFVTGVPHRTFETLRREAPVAWFEEREGSGFWAITRHADIVAVNRNYRRFSSRQGITSSPTMHFRRTATEDCEMHGRTIEAGDKVLLWIISGNHDESAFEDPFCVDLARDPNPHMAFGRGGPHACLGMWLARLELRVVLRELAGRVRSIRQAGPAARLRSNFINGIKSLPVAVVRE